MVKGSRIKISDWIYILHISDYRRERIIPVGSGLVHLSVMLVPGNFNSNRLKIKLDVIIFL